MSKFFSLFDTGSPISCIKKSILPFPISTEKKLTSYRGIGNKNLNVYGRIKCEIHFGNRKCLHSFFILPDEEAVVPILVGRDLLSKFNIQLCQIKYSYTRDELLKLNSNEMP